jgi:hypothetical protein
MKNLTITISNAEFEKLGIKKENLTFSAFVELIKNEISKQPLNILNEPAGKYAVSKVCVENKDTRQRKNRIKSKIEQLKDDVSLQQIEALLNSIFESLEFASSAIRPVRAQISVEEMVKEQNFTGINRPEFDKLISQIDIEEPLIDLLKSA